jgi:hypothetical protein
VIHPVSDDERLAEIGLVLDPVQMDLEIIEDIAGHALVKEPKKLGDELTGNGAP